MSDLEFSVDHKILLLKLTILSSETIDFKKSEIEMYRNYHLIA